MRMTSASSVIAVAEPETYENGSLILLERKDSTANATPNGRLDHVPPMSRLVTLARPEGFEHALPTIVIEGVEESVEALRAA